MVRASRYIYVFTAWAFAVGVLAQVLFIGMGLPPLGNQPSMTDLHRNFGWLLHLWPLLILLFAFLSKAGATHWRWALALALVVFRVPVLVGLRTSAPEIAALHPVLALVAFALAVMVAIKSLRPLREVNASGIYPSA